MTALTPPTSEITDADADLASLVALTRLVAETEQRRSEQIDRIAQLREQTDHAALAGIRLAEQVLKEIEATLGLARAYQPILQSLSET